MRAIFFNLAALNLLMVGCGRQPAAPSQAAQGTGPAGATQSGTEAAKSSKPFGELASIAGPNQGSFSHISGVALSPDGKTVASKGYNGEVITLWNAATGKKIAELKGHKNAIFRMAFLPDGKSLISASVDKTIKIWDVGAAKEKKTLVGHGSILTATTWLPGKELLAFMDLDGDVFVCSLASGKQIAVIERPGSFGILAFSPDGKELAAGVSDGMGKEEIQFWDWNAKKKRHHHSSES